jgi:hypothetical protein
MGLSNTMIYANGRGENERYNLTFGSIRIQRHARTRAVPKFISFRLLRPILFSFSDGNRKPSSWAVARLVAQRHKIDG